MARGHKRETKPRMDVRARDDVSPEPVDDPLHGIEGNAVPGMPCLESLGLSGLWRAFSEPPLACATGLSGLCPHLQGIIGNEAADRGNGGTRQAQTEAGGFEEDAHLVLAEVRMCRTDDFDVSDDLDGPAPQTKSFWPSRPFIQ